MKRAGKNSGYTLIEMVVYTAILASLSLFVANVLLASFNSLKAARANRRVVLSAETALERMTREIRLASSIDEVQSVFGSNPSELALNSVVSAQDPTPISKSFFISDGRLAFQEGGGAIKFLSAPNAVVSSFVLTRVESLHSEAVKINVALESEGSPGVTRTFHAGAVLRGSY